MESDLSRYHHIDYRDRWRFDPDGVRRLTLRMILVRLRHLPDDASTRRATGGHGWTIDNYLLAHLFNATSGEEHPWLPKTVHVVTPERAKAITGARKRRADREQAIAAGLIT